MGKALIGKLTSICTDLVVQPACSQGDVVTLLVLVSIHQSVCLMPYLDFHRPQDPRVDVWGLRKVRYWADLKNKVFYTFSQI